MPIRLATSRDLSTITSIYASAFYDEELHATLFPYRSQYPDDYARAWRHRLLEEWWNYRKVYVVSYEVEKGVEVLTGVAEWTRYDKNWTKQWGAKGWWDPRLIISPLIRAYNTIHRLLFVNRASRQPTLTDPNPCTYWTWQAATYPFISHHFRPPNALIANTAPLIMPTPIPTSHTPLLQPDNAIHNNKGHIELAVLAVLPTYQNRGHGRQLAQWGLPLARRENVPAVVVSADFKENFYRRCGFTELVGYATEGEGNPLRRMGVGGGAVLWTGWPWRVEEEEIEEEAEGERRK